MKNVFLRVVNVQELKDKPLADYTPSELVAYLTHAFPGDPKGALKVLRDNYEVGSVLANTTSLLLEGLLNVKRD